MRQEDTNTEITSFPHKIQNVSDWLFSCIFGEVSGRPKVSKWSCFWVHNSFSRSFFFLPFSPLWCVQGEANNQTRLARGLLLSQNGEEENLTFFLCFLVGDAVVYQIFSMPVVASFARRLRPKESPDEFLNATNVSKSFSGALQAFSPTTSKATFSQWAFDAPFARSLRKLYFGVSQLSFCGVHCT